MALIELDGLRRQQVYGDGIAGKRVHHQDVKMLRLLGSQRKARITRSNLYRRLRFTGITEDIRGNPFNQRVNFIATKHVAGTAIRSQCPGAEPDDTYTARPVFTT